MAAFLTISAGGTGPVAAMAAAPGSAAAAEGSFGAPSTDMHMIPASKTESSESLSDALLKKDMFVGDWEVVYAIYGGQRISRDTMQLEMVVSLLEDDTCKLKSVQAGLESSETGVWEVTESGIIITENTTSTKSSLLYDEAADHLFLPMNTADDEEGFVLVRSGSEEAENAANGIFDLGQIPEEDPNKITYTIEEKDMIKTDTISMKSQNEITFSPEKGAEMSFTVTNNTDHGIAVAVKDDCSYINDFQITCSSRDWSAFISSGETQTVNFHFDEKLMQLAGIKEIESVDLCFYAINRDDFTANPISGELQSFTTGVKAERTAFADAPQIFEGKGIRLYYTGPNTLDSLDGYTYTDTYVVENIAETEKSVLPWGSKINGQEISMIVLTHILPGKKALARPLVSTDKLEEAGIKEITSIVSTFHISDEFGGESGLTEEVTLFSKAPQ